MKNIQSIHVRNRDAWRAWLEKNHTTKPGIWLVFYKRRTGRAVIPYEDAIEEALCFGWIDSVIRSVDANRYSRMFTPRKPGSRWSALNKRRAQKMIREGRMTAAGLASRGDTGPQDDYGRTAENKKRDLVIPPYFKQALLKNPKAWEYFRSLAPSYRRSYILWIKAAKTDETRKRRLDEAVQLLKDNKKLGLR
jgi:uncharacterized protein YdeI (YjbR/CyaY-like superfamily)